jgi:hypothetical protein
MDLAVDHHLSVWDAVIVAAAAEAGYRLVLSEEMQEGFTWRGLTIVNPLAASSHPLLRALVSTARLRQRKASRERRKWAAA